MQGNQIIKKAVDTLTGKIIYSFTIKNKTPEVPKRTLWDWILRKPKVEPILSRDFEIYPCVVANQYRIAGEAITLPTDLFEDEGKTLTQHVPVHLPTMIYIIAAAIQNNYKEPEAELIEYLERNMDNIDISQTLVASLQAANMEAFTISIVLMTGASKILEPKSSPQDGSELIASHTPTLAQH